MFRGHDTGVEELLKRADMAMYQAKAAGRNTLRFFDPAMQASINARAIMESEMYRAIEEREFVLHYQPQVDRTGHCIGVEALLRWHSPKRGMVSPAEFIPLAEETGQILPIGHWVLLQACLQQVAWQADPATEKLVIAVNVSVSVTWPPRSVLVLPGSTLFQWVKVTPFLIWPRMTLGVPPMVVLIVPVTGPPPVLLAPASLPIVSALRSEAGFVKSPPLAPQDNSLGPWNGVPVPLASNVAPVKVALVE